jgi:hypothetical protein
MEEIRLKGTSCITKRIDFLTDLFEKAESRILHSDSFRQRNMNFALAIFAGLFAVGVKTEGLFLHITLSVSLFLLMLSFTIWDRKWHKTKHGWQESRDEFRTKLIELINKPDIDTLFFPYYKDGEKTAEKDSWQSIIFYCLTVGAVLSFLIFEFIQLHGKV